MEALFAGWPNVNPDDGVDGCPKGLTGVGPVPKEIVPAGLFPFPVSMRVGLSSIFIQSSSLDGGVIGRVWVLKEKDDGV